MKVKLKTVYAGPHGTGDSGDVIDLPDDVAASLLAARHEKSGEALYAERVPADTPVGRPAPVPAREGNQARAQREAAEKKARAETVAREIAKRNAREAEEKAAAEAAAKEAEEKAAAEAASKREDDGAAETATVKPQETAVSKPQRRR